MLLVSLPQLSHHAVSPVVCCAYPSLLRCPALYFLQEMLAPIKASADKSGLHETFVTDLADQCYRCAGGGRLSSSGDSWQGRGGCNVLLLWTLRGHTLGLMPSLRVFVVCRLLKRAKPFSMHNVNRTLRTYCAGSTTGNRPQTLTDFFARRTHHTSPARQKHYMYCLIALPPAGTSRWCMR